MEEKSVKSTPIQLVVVTPDRKIFDDPVRFVTVPLHDGEFGIDRDHGPMIGRLGQGELRIVGLDGKTERFFLDGGFVQVVDNRITVLTQRAVPAVAINIQVAREQLLDALKRPARSPEAMAIRDRLVNQARAQIRIAQWR